MGFIFIRCNHVSYPSSYSHRWVHSWFSPFIIQLNFFFKVVILFFILRWIFLKLPDNNHLSANHVLAIALNISHEPLESFLSSLPGARRWAYSSNEINIPAIFSPTFHQLPLLASTLLSKHMAILSLIPIVLPLCSSS